jgi:peptide/nickel transport system substrate-binding protein
MITRKTKRAFVASLTVAGFIVAGFTAPAHAARSTVVIHETNAFTSLNNGTPDTNLTTNADIAYVSGSGFNYYDDHKSLIQNTTFGSYAITKNKSNDFRVTYTIKPGRLWSDGTPITAVDLLLSHILSSSEYSIKAGLGDPKDAKVSPAFNSLGYGGTYDDNIVGIPTLSADKMSLTLQYKNPIPNWDLYGPGPSPVHALMEMANGKKALGTVAENNAATDAFLKAMTSYDSATLKKIAKIWSNDYNITQIDASTNPLLLVSNGGYIVSSAITNQSLTLKRNEKYNSGPAIQGGIDTLIFRFIADGTAASQALANGELDLYSGQATADAVTQLKALKGVTVANGTSACYEHLDLRTGPTFGTTDTYNGPFSDKSASGKDLRKAFLLAYPREEIVSKIVIPVNSAAVVPNSTFVLPGQTNYAKITAGNGSSVYSAKTQADRTAQALRIVQKYYPTASATNALVKVNLMVPAANSRRAAEAALVVPALKKAGFDVTASVTSGWSGKLNSSAFDAEFYAWCPSSVTQAGTNANFASDGTNNHMGWNISALDSVLKQLQNKLPDATVDQKIIQAERLINANALTAAIFQHPAVTAYNSTLKNVKPAPLSPNLVWNYWEWSY